MSTPTFPVLVTAAESEIAQRRAAAWLAGRGAGPGDRVALVAGPSAEYLALALGALRSGVIPVLLNAALTDVEQAALLEDAQPLFTVREPDLAGVVSGDTEQELAPWPLARAMMYTSGTTGRPKGVWTGVLNEAEASALAGEERDLWGFERGDRLLLVSPLHHSAPLRFAAGTLLVGGSVILAGGTAHQAEAIAAHRPTSAFVAPAHLQRLFADPAGVPSLSSFRLVAHAGAPCPEPLKRRALASFPTGSVWEFYGSTEGQFTACSPAQWLEHPGTVGPARPGRELEIDDDGTIWCHVPHHARFSYWNDEAKTARAWRGDAFSVGDIGRIEEGLLYLDGRRDDLIITGGVNVYPLEIEQAMVTCPGVLEAAVFPMDDDRWGQMVVAAVVGDVDETTLRSHLAERLAGYKLPKRIEHVQMLPHSPTGKLRRSRLAEELGLG